MYINLEENAFAFAKQTEPSIINPIIIVIFFVCLFVYLSVLFCFVFSTFVACLLLLFFVFYFLKLSDLVM